MALFASAFAPKGSTSSTGPINPFKSGSGSSTGVVPASSSPTSYSAQTSSKKRKRPGNEKSNGGDLARAAEVNVEKLMKQVGMTGKGSSRPDSPKVERHVAREVEDGPERASAFGEETLGGARQKKQKVKVGLDGRPINQAKSIDIGLPPPGTKKSKSKAYPTSTLASDAPRSPSAKPAKPSLVEPSTPMTKLQNTLSSRLDSAKFRWINEQLYARESGEAWEMMKRDGGGAFKDYHKSHRHQTSSWPSPPLPHILALLRPLPFGTFIVDLGCGDAGLAKALSETGKKVLSFDLVGDVEYFSDGVGAQGVQDVEELGKGIGEAKGKEKDLGPGWVVSCDFLNAVPLPGNPGGHTASTATAAELAPPPRKGRNKNKGGAIEVGSAAGPEIVDVVVCCLSLMGINWVGGIYEACRILRQGGEFHIAEVTSRLISKEAFIELIESFGFKLDDHSSPTTHFDLFKFTKTFAYPLGIVRGQPGWEGRVEEGESVMKGCAYKKR